MNVFVTEEKFLGYAQFLSHNIGYIFYIHNVYKIYTKNIARMYQEYQGKRFEAGPKHLYFNKIL